MGAPHYHFSFPKAHETTTPQTARAGSPSIARARKRIAMASCLVSDVIPRLESPNRKGPKGAFSAPWRRGWARSFHNVGGHNPPHGCVASARGEKPNKSRAVSAANSVNADWERQSQTPAFQLLPQSDQPQQEGAKSGGEQKKNFGWLIGKGRDGWLGRLSNF